MYNEGMEAFKIGRMREALATFEQVRVHGAGRVMGVGGWGGSVCLGWGAWAPLKRQAGAKQRAEPGPHAKAL